MSNEQPVIKDLSEQLIVALDFASRYRAEEFVAQLDPSLCKLKIGKELFTRAGPELVTAFVKQGYDLFLDLKFHDIPNTTAGAVAAAADLGVWMVNVHASGGSAMMEAAVNQLQGMGCDTLLTAVTVLTSLSEDDMHDMGVPGSVSDQVLRLATQAQSCGVDGVVCSGREAQLLSTHLGRTFLRVTPGIRPRSSVGDDQQRTMTPREALDNGSTHLVIGRPVTQADHPRQALLAIGAEISKD